MENTCNCKADIESLRLFAMTLQQEFLILRSTLCQTNFADELANFEWKLQNMWRTDVQIRMRKASEEAALLESEIVVDSEAQDEPTGLPQ